MSKEKVCINSESCGMSRTDLFYLRMVLGSYSGQLHFVKTGRNAIILWPFSCYYVSLLSKSDNMNRKENNLSKEQWGLLAQAAWECRERAYIFGEVKVGAAVLSDKGSMFSGCNVEHLFRSHDIHAEVNAITSMIAAGHKRLRAIIVVSDRKRFTPCGSCLDWIYQFGGPSGLVAYQAKKGGQLKLFWAKDLMPYYPMM